MARGQHVGAEVLRHLHQVDELHALVAGDARHRRLALPIGIGERLDHRALEALLVVEDVVRNAERGRHAARIVDILTGAAGALAVRRFAVVVELQRDAHDIVALAGEQSRHHRAVDAARHRDDNARVLGALGEIKRIQFHRYPSSWGSRPQ